MKYLLFLALFINSAFSYDTCPVEFPEVQLCGELVWSKEPVLNEKSEFVFAFWEMSDTCDLSNELPLYQCHNLIVPNLDVSIYSWMNMDNGHNHPGPLMTTRLTLEKLFHIQDARFFMHGMKGSWDIRIDLKEDDQVISRGSVPVKFNREVNISEDHHH